MPLSPIIRANVLSIFRAVQYFPLPQLRSTTTSNAMKFSLHRCCSCPEILVAFKCLRKCIRWHAIPLYPVPFIIHLIFIIFEIPTLPSTSVSSQLLSKKVFKSLLSILNDNGRRSHSREKPQLHRFHGRFFTNDNYLHLHRLRAFLAISDSRL